MLRAGVALALFAALLMSVLAGGRSLASNVLFYQRGHDQPGYGASVFPATSVTGVAATNPLIALGQRLFFDTRLSGTGAKSCASCHNPTYRYAEPRWEVSISDNGKLGRRNAPTLLDIAFMPKLMWDGRFQSLEQQVFGPFQSGEMGISIEEAARRANADPQYVSLFRAALGSFASPSGIAQVVAAWERTLTTPPSRVDRMLVQNDPGALTPLERAGYAVFTRRAGCTNCHQLFPVQPDGRPSARPLVHRFSVPQHRRRLSRRLCLYRPLQVVSPSKRVGLVPHAVAAAQRQDAALYA